MNLSSNLKSIFYVSLILILSGGCVKLPPAEDYSVTTGWGLNRHQWGGFEAKLKNSNDEEYSQFTWDGTKIPSNMVFVQGGSFVMGRTQEDVMRDGNNYPKEATVSSFWMDQTEITNLQYREYTYWMKRVFWERGDGEYAYLYSHALPDSTVWRSELSYNEPMVTQYFRHPAYQDYPVVGVSWQQAVDYCDWRTDRVNERRIVESGALSKGSVMKERQDPKKIAKTWERKYLKQDAYDSSEPDGFFNTEKYLKYEEYDLENWETPDDVKKGLQDLGANTSDTEVNWRKKKRKIRIEDGIFTAPYRLPTEAEWEFAAIGGNNTVDVDGNNHGKFYPWRSKDQDNFAPYYDDGVVAGRNQLRVPFDQDVAMGGLARQQYGVLRGNASENLFIKSITDGGEGAKNAYQGGYNGGIRYANYNNTVAKQGKGDIKFEEMRQGQFLANFRHGRGDYAGISPFNNDLGTMTMPVGSFPPNDWGLYDMAGNVSEWVMDVYRPLTPFASNDLNPFRGNLFKEVVRDEDGRPQLLQDLESEVPGSTVDDLYAKSLGLMSDDGTYVFPANPGTMVKINEQLDGNDDPYDNKLDDEMQDTDRYHFNDESPYAIYKGRDRGDINYNYDNPNSTHSNEDMQPDAASGYVRDAYKYLQPKSTNPRHSPKRQYQRANNIDYRDGQGLTWKDQEGLLQTGDASGYSGWGVYDYGRTTLINNYSRIYKGGSWQDDSYWLSPGTKRFLNEDLAQSDIGFRCVVDHLGYVSGGEYENRNTEANKKRDDAGFHNYHLWKYKYKDNTEKKTRP